MTQQDDYWNPDLAGDYDRIADFYADAYADDLVRTPFDQALLDRFAELVHGPVCDLGCGPGYVAAYLCLHGVQAFGIDLSPRMIDLARRRYPAIPFQVGDLRALDLPTDSVRGMLCRLSRPVHLDKGRQGTDIADVSNREL